MTQGDWSVDHSIELIPVDVPSVPSRPPRPLRGIGFYLIVTAAVLLSFASLATIGLIVARISNDRGKSITVTGHVDSDALRKESVHVFSSFDVRDDVGKTLSPEKASERAGIEALLRRLEECTAEKNVDGVRELIDFDRLLKRIELTGCLASWSNFEKRALKGELKTSAEVDPYWANIKLAGIVESSDDPNTRIVYAYCGMSEAEDGTEERFWLCREGDRWLIYDWERLDLGISRSREWSIYVQYARRPEIEGFERWGEFISEADALTSSGDKAGAEEKLHAAEAQLVPPELAGFRRVLTGYRWMMLGETAEAERCYGTVTTPMETPGALYGLMNCTRWKTPAVALKYAQDYENAVGPTADLLESKAQLLKSLGRQKDAVSEWKKLLRLRPTHTTALAEIFLALPKGDKSEFLRELERTDDPAGTAADIAGTISYQDYQQLLVLRKYLEGTAPDAAGTHFVKGFVKQLDGQYTEAAKLFRNAFEKESREADRSNYINSYVKAMAEAGEVLAPFDHVPDPRAAFDTLFFSCDEGEIELTEDEYRSVVSLYRERYPNNPDAIHREAELAINEERFEDAVKLLPPAIKALKEGDENAEYYRDSLTRSLATALYKLGKLEEAYLSGGERKVTFSQLTNLSISDGRWSDVVRLLELHREQSADDPHLYYVQGRHAAYEKRWDEAVQSFRAGRAAMPDENWIYAEPLTDAYIDSGRWSEYFSSSDNAAEDFEQLGDRFLSESSWDALRTLIDAYRRVNPTDIRIAKYEAEAAWKHGDYGTYLSHAQHILTQNDNTIHEYERRRVEDRVFSALLRTKQIGRARQRLRNMQDAENHAAKLAMLEAAAGDLDAAKRRSLQAAATHDNAATLYRDEVVGRIFLGEQFVEFQQKYPVEFHSVISTLGVLLFEDVPTLKAAVVEDALSEVQNAAVHVKALRTGLKDVEQAFAANIGEASVWVAAGRGKFDANWRLEDGQDAHGELLEKSNGWIAIGTASWSGEERERAEAAARTGLSRLIDLQPRAICDSDRSRWRSFAIYPITPQVLSKLKAGGRLQQLDVDGSTITEVPKNNAAENRQFGQSLRQAARTFESGPEVRLEVVSFLSDEPSLEPLTLEVTTVKRIYGGVAFDGVLKNGSLLIPELKAGLPMRFWEHQVQASRIDGESPVYRP